MTSPLGGAVAQHNNVPLPPSDGPTQGNRACFWCTETSSQVGDSAIPEDDAIVRDAPWTVLVLVASGA
jgi:hypothetical protein